MAVLHWLTERSRIRFAAAEDEAPHAKRERRAAAAERDALDRFTSAFLADLSLIHI